MDTSLNLIDYVHFTNLASILILSCPVLRGILLGFPIRSYVKIWYFAVWKVKFLPLETRLQQKCWGKKNATQKLWMTRQCVYNSCFPSHCRDFLSYTSSLCSCDRASWAKLEEREYQKDATILMFIINYCLNMFRASLCPSSGEQRPCITAYGVLRW